MQSKLLQINKRGQRADFDWLSALETILARKFKILARGQQIISLALVSKSEIRRLNRVYRHQNKITDVLSFNIDSQEILGEVVICLEIAKKQAQDKRETISSELKLLTIYGILHLLGYDHQLGLKHAKQQSRLEEEVLNLLKQKIN